MLIILSTMLSSCLIDLLYYDKTPGYFTYQDFTDEEKNLFKKHIGVVIPFLATDDYGFSSFNNDGDYSEGIRFYTLGNTAEEFASYRQLYSDYELANTHVDEMGDTWYYYSRDNVTVAMAIYRSFGQTVVDIYVYCTSMGVLTNEGAGLPEGVDGVHKLDFTKAEYITNVTELSDYVGGCPTVGSPAVLVIPVEFSDCTASSRGYYIEKIKKAFNGKTGETDYYSVDEYYKTSSYGKLDLDITVLDEWFRPAHPSTYYKFKTEDYDGETVEIGDQMILNEALDYLDDKMDLSKFDSDKNGTIDAVVMINTLKVSNGTNYSWAYRYWNIYSDESGELYEYDGVWANDYLWMSYGFMHETTNVFGDVVFTDKSALNTKTYIHEMGHILGADDYYDTSDESNDPMHGYDIMDDLLGDHNAFTKFNLGWITTSRLVTATDSITLTLKPFAKSGDSIIIANDWDDSLGAYQEYYVLTYYTVEGLNKNDNNYFDNAGIIVYHVNSSLYYESTGSDSYYAINNNNTHPGDGYGTVDNLIEFVKFINVGGSLPTQICDGGKPLRYSFTVESITEGEATIRFKVS